MGTDFNLYEFPEGYSGRRTYVSVRGHERSIPTIYTYKGTDGRNYVSPEYGGDLSGYSGYSTTVQMPMFIRDIGEYVSPLDGSHITSRSQHREHIRKHDVIEVGNERVGRAYGEAPPAVPRDVAVRDIKRYLEKVDAMPQAEYDSHVAKKQYEASTAAAECEVTDQ